MQGYVKFFPPSRFFYLLCKMRLLVMPLLAHHPLTWHPVLFCMWKETTVQQTCDRPVEIPHNSVVWLLRCSGSFLFFVCLLKSIILWNCNKETIVRKEVVVKVWPWKMKFPFNFFWAFFKYAFVVNNLASVFGLRTEQMDKLTIA